MENLSEHFNANITNLADETTLKMIDNFKQLKYRRNENAN